MEDNEGRTSRISKRDSETVVNSDSSAKTRMQNRPSLELKLPEKRADENSNLYEDLSGDEQAVSSKDDLLSPIDPDSPLLSYSLSPSNSPGTPETAQPASDFNHPGLGFWSAPLSGGKSRQLAQEKSSVISQGAPSNEDVMTLTEGIAFDGNSLFSP